MHFSGIPDVLMHWNISLCRTRTCFTAHYKRVQCVQKSLCTFVFARVHAVSLYGLRLNCIRLEDDEMNMGVALPADVIDSCNINEINGQSYENTSFLLLESPFCVRSKALMWCTVTEDPIHFCHKIGIWLGLLGRSKAVIIYSVYMRAP